MNSDISSLDRSVFTLPTKYGGSGIPNIVEGADFEYEMSKTLSAPLAALIVIQSQNRLPEEPTSMELKNSIIRQRETRLKQQVETTDEKLSPEMIKTITQAWDKGASNWLNVLPLEEEGYVFTKEEFWDLLASRYSQPIQGLPSFCPCGQMFNTVHATECKEGGLVHSRHDEIVNLEAALLSKVYKYIMIEPSLQLLTWETLPLLSTITDDGA